MHLRSRRLASKENIPIVQQQEQQQPKQQEPPKLSSPTYQTRSAKKNPRAPLNINNQQSIATVNDAVQVHQTRSAKKSSRPSSLHPQNQTDAATPTIFDDATINKQTKKKQPKEPPSIQSLTQQLNAALSENSRLREELKTHKNRVAKLERENAKQAEKIETLEGLLKILEEEEPILQDDESILEDGEPTVQPRKTQNDNFQRRRPSKRHTQQNDAADHENKNEPAVVHDHQNHAGTTAALPDKQIEPENFNKEATPSANLPVLLPPRDKTESFHPSPIDQTERTAARLNDMTPLFSRSVLTPAVPCTEVPLEKLME